MKKYIYILFILFSFFHLNANSQTFIGGSIRLRTSNSSNTANISHNINISPDFGKFITDKLALGISLKLSSNKYQSAAGVTDQKNSSFGINPFLRYNIYTMNKFSVFGQGNIGLEFNKEKPFQITEETKKIRTYISFNPGLSYDLTDHLMFQTSLNFLSIGYNYSTTIDKSPKEKTSSFNFDSSLDDILFLGNLTIGALYKF